MYCVVFHIIHGQNVVGSHETMVKRELITEGEPPPIEGDDREYVVQPEPIQKRYRGDSRHLSALIWAADRLEQEALVQPNG